MRTQEEIQKKIEQVGSKLDACSYSKREVIDAVLDVLENNISDEEIEEKYFDEHQTNRESSANRARQWMDGVLTDEEFWF